MPRLRDHDYQGLRRGTETTENSSARVVGAPSRAMRPGVARLRGDGAITEGSAAWVAPAPAMTWNAAITISGAGIPISSVGRKSGRHATLATSIGRRGLILNSAPPPTSRPTANTVLNAAHAPGPPSWRLAITGPSTKYALTRFSARRVRKDRPCHRLFGWRGPRSGPLRVGVRIDAVARAADLHEQPSRRRVPPGFASASSTPKAIAGGRQPTTRHRRRENSAVGAAGSRLHACRGSLRLAGLQPRVVRGRQTSSSTEAGGRPWPRTHLPGETAR